MSLVQGHTLRPTPYRIMVMLKTSVPQGGYFKSPHISMTLRKDQANAMCATKTFFFFFWKESEQPTLQKQESQADGSTTPYFVLFFFYCPET